MKPIDLADRIVWVREAAEKLRRLGAKCVPLPQERSMT